MVKLAMWNNRGVNTQIKHVEVHNLLFDNKIDVLGLLETKVKEENMKKVLEGICNWRVQTNYLDAVNGRVWVIWNPATVIVEELQQGNQYIHCRITALFSNRQFLATFVYANNSADERMESWQSMQQIANSVNDHWAVLGDLNTTLHYEERTRGGFFVAENTSELEEVVSQCELQDLPYTGVYLTWCNKQEGEARVYAKLDRILVNDKWLQEIDGSNALYLNSGISDHSPGILCIAQQKGKQVARFKFCNF